MYCVGRRMKFRSCNSEPCSKQKKDFREEQCAAFDGRQFNINGLPPNVRWVPKYSGSEDTSNSDWRCVGCVVKEKSYSDLSSTLIPDKLD